MTDPTTPRTRMTREYLRISASSGSPLVPPRASPCVTSPLSTREARIQRRLLGLARPAHTRPRDQSSQLLHLAHDLLHGRLRVAEQEGGVLVVEERVLDACEARVH